MTWWTGPYMVNHLISPVIYYHHPLVTLALVVCLLRLLHLCVVHDQYNDYKKITFVAKKKLIFEDMVPLVIIEFS